MVESEADGLNEEVMLGAVMFGHEQMQIAIKAINELAAEAGKPKWLGRAGAEQGIASPQSARFAETAVAAAYTLTEKSSVTPRSRRSRAAAVEALSQGRGAEIYRRPSRRASSPIWNIAWCASKILDGHPRIDGRDTKTVRAINIRTGVLARTHGSALFTRGETQALVVTTLGTGRDAQIIDGLTGETQRAVHAALQLPSVQRRRDRHDGFAEAARDRPRQSGQARRQGRDAGRGEVPVRHPRGIGNSRVERLELHGLGVRHQPRADGRGRADQGAGGRRRHGPGQGRRALPGAHGHFGRRRSSRRHGFQGGRHEGRHHRAADGHQDHEHHARDHEGGAGSGARRAVCTSWAR